MNERPHTAHAAPARPAPVRIVVFHGTGTSFKRFDESSIGRGTETEPNNRLGVYLTALPSEAAEYAYSSSQGDEQAKILVVTFEGRLAPAFFSALDNFVTGDLHDTEGHAISDAFCSAHALALAGVGSGEKAQVDACAVFASVRASLRQQFDALWIENGQSAFLCVFNPECLRIDAALTPEQGELLEQHLERANAWHFGEDAPGSAEQAMQALGMVLSAQARQEDDGQAPEPEDAPAPCQPVFA